MREISRGGATIAFLAKKRCCNECMASILQGSLPAGYPLWRPPGHEDRAKWIHFHGMTEKMFNDLTMKVVECKVLMLIHNENITVSHGNGKHVR